MDTLLPKALTCASNAGSSQLCDCEDVFTASTNKNNLRCTCRQNVSTPKNVTTLVSYNVTRQVNVTYNMTVNVTVNTTSNGTASNTTTANTTTSNSTNETIQQIVEVTELRNYTTQE